ncbi:hypothetical protein PV396_42375 [Streptomyces sp. ME02-8801-2C]|uniref:hypothetical protein n=1 Tax=Streptomyces sp. ME02-8801-2C TaxID=3028680 RepID=UPI0029B1149F|nr:hypothetical protein [Streptomyces sp. ME02-8801-2C]MDX3458511.1 hypothetical protein [Streptomyces sp. ME02-8801-2C]
MAENPQVFRGEWDRVAAYRPSTGTRRQPSAVNVTAETGRSVCGGKRAASAMTDAGRSPGKRSPLSRPPLGPDRRARPARAPGYPRILTVFNEVTGPLWGRGVRSPRPRIYENIECTRVKLKRLVRIDVPTEADIGSFPMGQWPRETCDQWFCPNVIERRTSHHELPSGWAFTWEATPT